MAMIMKKVKEFFFGKKEIKTTPAELNQKLKDIKDMVAAAADIEEIKAVVSSFVAELDALDAQVAGHIKDLMGRTGWIDRDAVNMDLARLQKGKNHLAKLRTELAETVKPLGIEVAVPTSGESQNEIHFGG